MSHVRDLATVTTDTNTDVNLPVQSYEAHPEMIVSVAITGTITIQILGSIDGVVFTELLAASAASQSSPVAYYPIVRITSTGTSGGSAAVKALLGSGPRP